MPDQSHTHVFGSHLILEEERRRFRATVDQLEKQRAEAQEEVDELINALRRERDLGDEEIIFLKAQLRGFSATKYETDDKVDNLEKENAQLKEDLKKETYKRKKLKERFIELQDLVNDENVVLLKEVEKRDDEIDALKEDIAEVKDKLVQAEGERDKASDKEERLLEECEKLNSQVDELEDQLRASARDIMAFKIVLDEKGINTDDVFDDVLVQAKTDLEEAKRDKEDLVSQLEEIKEAVDDAQKELLEEIEAKERKINQLKRAMEDKEYLHQTKQDDLFLENEKLKEDVEQLKEQLQEHLNNPSEALPELGVSKEKYEQLLKEMEREREERNKLKNQYKDLKSYIDKDTADLIAEVQERDAVIESMNDKLKDLDELDKLEAELDWEKKQRRIDEAKIAELRNAITQDKRDIVADSEKKSDMIRQLKATLTDAKTNLERARFKQREIIAHNQKLRADNQALQKELDDLKSKGVPGTTPPDRRIEDLLEELKDSNKDLEKERELRGQLHNSMQELKDTLSDEDADLVDEIQKRDIIIANLHCQLREETDRLNHQLRNHRQREEQILDDYQTIRDRIDDIEQDCEPIGHQPEIKDLERDMFEDLTHWLEDEVRILDVGLNDRVTQLADLEELLRSTPSFDEERVHYVKEIAAQEKEVNELRALNRRMERVQREHAKKYAKKLEALNRENEALRRQLGGDVLETVPIEEGEEGSTDSLPMVAMEMVDLDESGLGVSVTADTFDMQRTTPVGQAEPVAPSAVPEKHDDSKEKELVGQLRQIYSNLDLCRQDINRIVESFHDRIVRHHPRLQRTDSPTRLDARNIGATINSLIEGYHTQVTDLINRLNTDSSTFARRNENLEDVVQQLESNLNQERSRYDQLHARCKSYRQEIQDLRSRLREGNIPTPRPLEGDHANHDLCQAVHDLLNDLDSGPSTADGRRARAPSIQEISRLLLPVAEQVTMSPEATTPDGAAFKEDCDIIQEKTDELSDLVKSLNTRLDAQKQAKIDALQEKVKEYEREMDRLRDLIGDESEKDNEIEALRDRNRQLALNLRDSQEELDSADRKNNILTDKFREANDALQSASDELAELRRKTREREAYIRQLQENLRKADENLEEKDQSNENLRNNCDELQEKAQQLSLLIKEIESKYVEKSRQYTILEKDITKVRDDHRVITEFCDKKNSKIEELEDDLRDLMKENEKLTEENKELTDETQVKDEKIKELEHRLDAKEQLITELEKIASKMSDDIAERDKVLQSMNDEVEKLEKEVERLEKELAKLGKDLEDKDKDLEQLEKDLDDKEKELEEKDKELDDKEKDLEDREKELDEKDKDLEEKEKELEDKDKLLDDKEKELEDKDKELDDKEKELVDKDKELDEKEKELEDKDKELDEKEKQLDEKDKELDEKDNELDNRDETIKNLEEDLDKQDQEIEKLENEVDDLKEKLKAKEDEAKHLEDEKNKLEDDKEKLEDDKKKLEDENKELDDEKKKLEDTVAELEDVVEGLNEDLDKLENALKDKDNLIEDLKNAVDELEKDIEDGKIDNDKLNDEIKDLENALEDVKKELDEVKDQLDEAKDEADKLAEDNKKLDDYVKDLEDTLKEEKAANDELDEENDKLKEEADKLNDVVADQKDDMEKLADIIQDLERDVADANKDNNDLRDETEDLKEKLEDALQQKQDILDEVKDAMEDMDGEREGYKDNLQQLKDFLEAQKNDMDELKSQIPEKPETEERHVQTDLCETRAVRQQTDEVETTHALIQADIEEEKPVCRSRRVQTDVDPVMAAKATRRTEIKKSSSMHILKNIVNTIDRPTQTANLF